MKIKILIVLLGLVFLFQGCSQKVKTKIVAVASPDQKTLYDGSVISENRHVVTLSLYDKIEIAKERTIFKIILQNRGDSPVKFSKENISVTFEDNDIEQVAKELKIQSGDSFLKYLKDAYLNEENRIIEEILRTTEIDAKSIAMAKSENAKKVIAVMYAVKLSNTVTKMEDMREDIGQFKETIPIITYKDTTIQPSDTYIGILVCDTSEMIPKIKGKFKIVVSVEDETHEFTFMRS